MEGFKQIYVPDLFSTASIMPDGPIANRDSVDSCAKMIAGRA